MRRKKNYERILLLRKKEKEMKNISRDTSEKKKEHSCYSINDASKSTRIYRPVKQQWTLNFAIGRTATPIKHSEVISILESGICHIWMEKLANWIRVGFTPIDRMKK